MVTGWPSTEVPALWSSLSSCPGPHHGSVWPPAWSPLPSFPPAALWGSASTSPGRETVTLPGRNFPAVSPPCSLTLPQLAMCHGQRLAEVKELGNLLLLLCQPPPPPAGCRSSAVGAAGEQCPGSVLGWDAESGRCWDGQRGKLWLAPRWGARRGANVPFCCIREHRGAGSWAGAGGPGGTAVPGAGCVQPHVLPLQRGDVCARLPPVTVPALSPAHILPAPGSAGG